MKKLTIILILLLALTACGGAQPEATAVPPTAEPPATAEPTAKAEPTDEPTAEPTPEPEPTAVAPTANLTDGCVTDYAEGIDYFPQKTAVVTNAGFTIEYFDSYKLLTVPEPYPGAETAVTYLLVQCGTPAPEGFDDATVIEIPINSFVSMSTTYLPHLVTLGVVDRLVGVDSAGLINTPEVRALADAGQLAEVGFGGDVNVETMLDLNPDLVMTYASGSPDFDAHPKLQEVGIPVALNADFLEVNPLGNAEWGKFIAAFFNQDATADAWFADVADQYDALAARTANLAMRPTVFTQTPYEGTWFVPGGGSYTANLLFDAGADYVWADDDATGSLFLDFETVFDQAASADYWLDIGFFGSLADLQAADERFTDFAAFQNGNVYNNDGRINAFGGNDFYESGAANPHLVLADLIKIFHPDLVPDHDFVYYRQVD